MNLLKKPELDMNLPSLLDLFRWHAIPALILAFGLGVSGLAFYKATMVDDARVSAEFERRSEWASLAIRDKIRDALEPVQALASFITAQDDMLPEEFDRFAVATRLQSPVVRLSWLPLVRNSERAEFEAEVRRFGMKDFTIRERGEGNTLVAVGARDEYLPARFQHDFDTLRSSIGLDFASEPLRRALLARARDEGVPIATPPTAALSGLPRPPSYALFWPVYDHGPVPADAAARHAGLTGFAVGTFRYDTLFSAVVAGLPDVGEDIALFVDPPAGQFLGIPIVQYRSAEKQLEIGTVSLSAPAPGALRIVSPVAEFGRVWTIVQDYSPASVNAERSPARWAYLGIGMILSLMLSGYTLNEQRRRIAVESTIRERTDELRQASELLKAMVSASPFAIVGFDSVGRVQLWNHSAEKIFLYCEEEVLGRPYLLVSEQDSAAFEKWFHRVASGEVLRGLDSLSRRKDGKTIETRISAAPVYDQHGVLQGVIVELEDVTERNHLDRQLRQAQKMEAIGLLTGGVSHDFNNLLGIIMGNLEMALEQVRPDSELHEVIGAAMQATLRGSQLTKQMLAFASRQPLAPALIDPATALANTGRLLRRTLSERIALDVLVDDDIGSLLIDVAQFESAIINLAVNARDAMPNGGRLTIEAVNVSLDEAAHALNPEAKPGDYVMVAVSDTGTGMAPETLAHVFEPFFTTKGGKGSGLGLSMVHGFVKQSGGFSKIYSEIGRGTAIRLYLPRAAADAQPHDSAVPSTDVPTGSEIILVVEDNDGMRTIALRQLQSLGYRTLDAVSASVALDILRRGDAVDLLFTDVVMPGGMDGRALAEAASQIRPNLAVLLTSGFTPAAVAAIESADRFTANLLSKPYSKTELARRIRAALDNAHRGDAHV